MSTKNKFLIILIGSLIVFSPALTNYFSGDDWFHLRLTDIHSIGEFINFFSFSSNLQTASFYRPIPTQLFFFIFQKLFGLNPIIYYLFGLLLFATSLILIYKFINQLTKNHYLALLTIFFYGFSVTNFTRLYFISAFQELFLVNFIMISLLLFIQNKNYPSSLIFFVLALMSKETAVILPFLIILTSVIIKKINWKKIIPYFVILVPYLFLRLTMFHAVVGDSYIWNFSPLKTINTLSWYVLWSIGAPELLVDYVSSGLKILPRFFTDYPFWSYVTLSLLALNLIVLTILTLKTKFNKLIFPFTFFVISLLPVIFLPVHKFTLELGLPLVGFALLLATLVEKEKKLSYLFISSFLVLNLSMNYLTYTRHYTVSRSKIARNIVSYFQSNYPNYPEDKSILFVNDTGNYGKDWGSSKQISFTTSGSDLFKVIYNNSNANVYFQDLNTPPSDKSIIKVSTRQFFQ